MKNYLEFKEFKAAVCENCGCVRKSFKSAVFTDLVSNEDCVVTFVDGNVARSLVRGQLVVADLLRDEAARPCSSCIVAESIMALDKKVVDLRHKKRRNK